MTTTRDRYRARLIGLAWSWPGPATDCRTGDVRPACRGISSKERHGVSAMKIRASFKTS
jgi:hypothetical protein